MSDFNGITQAAKTYYEDALAVHGEGPKAVNWRDQETQELRFDMLLKIGDISEKRVHDVGCGLAHFNDYLIKRRLDCHYIGTDISGKMIEAARTQNSGDLELYEANILTDEYELWMSADYVVNSGLFTVRGMISDKDWWIFVQSMIQRMYDLSSIGIAFNLMTTFVNYRDDHLFYKHPGEVMEYCMTKLSRKVIIRHDYPLWEYMVYVYK